MTKSEFDRLRVGDKVWTHMSNSYRQVTIAVKKPKHALVRTRAAKGDRLIERWATYYSLSLTKEHMTTAEIAAYRREVLKKRR